MGERVVRHTVQPVDLDISLSRSAAPEDVQKKALQIQTQLSALEHNLSSFEDTATVLFLHWSAAHSEGDQTTAFATAKLFNRLTYSVRQLRPASPEITQLGTVIADDMQQQKDAYDPEALAHALEEAAQARTHERSWPWVVLPTFPKQHYGRSKVDVVTAPDVPYKIYVTQPTFVDGATLLHTHGRNWSFARPLGQAGTKQNHHINTLWEPQSEQDIFPIRKVDQEKQGEIAYHAGEVVVIRPKAIHAIERQQIEFPACSFEVFASLTRREQRDQMEQARFGELSSLHIYRADPRIAAADQDATERIDGTAEEAFFEMYDMIVLDRERQQLWAGNGGAWERRMVTYGETGEHCGKCFHQCVEGDNRSGNLNPAIIQRDLLVVPSPGILVYRREG